jgi:hypothetical protein
MTPHQKAYNDDDLLSGRVTYTDGQLYRDIADRVRHGQSYYTAAVEVQREHDYPVRPALTVREPALALATAALGGIDGMRIAIGVLIVIVMVAGFWRLERLAVKRWEFWIAVLLLAAGAGHVLAGELPVVHEAWAGLLVMLSMLVWRRERFWPAVVIAVAACLIRELAVPYVLVMLMLALTQRRRSEAVAWLAGLSVVAAGLVAHAVLVYQHTVASDHSSPGWLVFGGWGFALRTVYNTTLITPYAATAVIVPLAVLGWLGRRDDIGLRVAGFTAGMAIAFTCVGRPENFYWGYVYSTPLVVGLTFAPAALWTLARRTLVPSTRR